MEDKIVVVSVRLPAALYAGIQKAARQRAVDEQRTVSAPGMLRELAEREWGPLGWAPVDVQE